MYVTRLASNEIIVTIKKKHREVGLAKDLSQPMYDKITTKVPKPSCVKQVRICEKEYLTSSLLRKL